MTKADELTVRPLCWPQDRAALLALDTSFSTDRVVCIAQSSQSFTLEVTSVSPPIQKAYPLANELESLPTFAWVGVAETSGIVGMAAIRIEEWNRRAVLHHLYVSPSARGKGVGRMLVKAALEAAQEQASRCLWAETQTVNPGAVRFYERMGFTWCGLDTSLYDPAQVGAGEVALFFARDIG